MFLIRGRNRSRQSVAPCPSTAAPSTSSSFSLRVSTNSHSTSASSSLPARRPSGLPLYQQPTMTDGWVCDPAISALHFSYALTQAAAAADDDDSDADRCGLQSPRPLHSPCDSPVSFLSLDGCPSTRSHGPPTAATAATVPTTYRRVVLLDSDKQTGTQSANKSNSAAIGPKPSPNSTTSKTNIVSSSSSSSGGGCRVSGKTSDWLQSSLRLAFRRRTVDDRTTVGMQQSGSDGVVVVAGDGRSSDKSVQSSLLQMRKLSLPLPQR